MTEFKVESKIKPIPWQKRKEIGFPAALFNTCRQVLFKPAEFFECLEMNRTLEPFLFYFSVSGISGALLLLFEVFIERPKDWMSYLGINFLIVLLVSAGSIYLIALLLNIAVIISDGQGDFRQTFSIVAYAGAANIFNIIPYLGAALISPVWMVIILFFAVRRVYQLNKIKAFFSALAPLVIILFVLVLFTLNRENYTKSRIETNQKLAQDNLKSIALALEDYSRRNNGDYPESEHLLLDSNPAYLKRAYNRKTIDGYAYFLNLTSRGYQLLAGPVNCGFSGIKVYKVVTGGVLFGGDCE